MFPECVIFRKSNNVASISVFKKLCKIALRNIIILILFILIIVNAFYEILTNFVIHNLLKARQWRSVSALKAGRREEGGAGSIPGHACRPSRSEFSVVFSETR